MNDTKRRNNRDVEADIIRVALGRGGALKTQIVYGANLNFRIVKDYLADLMGRGLIELDGSRYIPTERARDYLVAYETLCAL